MADLDPPHSWFSDTIMRRSKVELYAKGVFKAEFEIGEWVYVRLKRNPRLPASEWVKGMVVGVQLSWKIRYRLAFPISLEGSDDFMAATEYRFRSTDLFREIPTDEKPKLSLV